MAATNDAPVLAPTTLSNAGTGIGGGRVLLWMLLVLAVVAAPTLGITYWLGKTSRAAQLPRLGQVPDFTLLDERGQTFTAHDLRDQVTIINFIFTRCTSICPATTLKMQRIQDKTAATDPAIRLLSFSVDPTHDQPTVLAAYAKRYGVDETRWHFLTGSEAEMQRLVNGPFMNSMDRDGTQADGSPNIAHSAYFLLIGPDREIRGAYDGNDLVKLDQLMRNARQLMRATLRARK